MKRVVVLGPGGSGKSTFAAQLGTASGLPVVELDAYFWGPQLEAKTPAEWSSLQRKLVSADRWILDGDLGPYDALDIHLSACDTIVVLDFSTWRCVWRALRRSRERLDFWRWLLTWRRVYRPALLASIGRCAPQANLHLPQSPRQLDSLRLRLTGAAL
jgi:adenylate kinase family enzyme